MPSSTTSKSQSTPLPAGTNLALLTGSLSSAPQVRTLPSGDELLQLEVTVRPAGERAESVPVAWLDPATEAAQWPAGHEVVVVGRVRRRFFRTGAGTASRTEVVATTVVPASRRAAARKAVSAALAVVGTAPPG